MKRLLSLFFALSLALSGLATMGVAQNQTAPRPQGNWFEFRPQLAQNTLLISRFPSGWTVPASRPFIMGFGVPFTADATANAKYFSNAGFTHAERDFFVNRLNTPIAKRYRLITDQDAKGQAGPLANSLAGNDPRRQPLLDYANGKQITATDFSVYELLGRQCYYACKGAGLGFVGFDIEDFAGGTSLDKQENFQRSANLGLAKAIAEDNAQTKFFQYGGSLADVVTYIKNKQDGDIYMRIPSPIWRGGGGVFDKDATAIGTWYRTHGGFVGRDQYARRTFDDRSLWQKNADGSIKLDANGNPIYVKAVYGQTTITNFGRSANINTYEAMYWHQMWYEEMDKILCDWRWWCNTTLSYDGNQVVGQMPYPKGTIDPREGIGGTGANGIHLSSFYRDDTESEGMYNPDNGQMEEAANSNRRPLNPRSTRFQMLMRSVLYHGNILWSDKGYYDFTQGKVYTHEGGGQQVTEPNLAMGQWEAMIAGNYQGKMFPKLFDWMDAGQIEFIIPKRFIYKGNVSVGEREIDKPIVWLMQKQNSREVFALWSYPAQDVGNVNHEIDITTWIVLDNGTTSGSWKLHCKDRNACFDAWMKPVGFEGAKPENYRFQFTTLLGQTFTWTGNYNVPFVGANPTPPAPIVRTLISQTVHVPFAPPASQLATTWSPLQGIVLGMAN